MNDDLSLEQQPKQIEEIIRGTLEKLLGVMAFSLFLFYPAVFMF